MKTTMRRRGLALALALVASLATAMPAQAGQPTVTLRPVGGTFLLQDATVMLPEYTPSGVSWLERRMTATGIQWQLRQLVTATGAETGVSVPLPEDASSLTTWRSGNRVVWSTHELARQPAQVGVSNGAATTPELWTAVAGASTATRVVQEARGFLDVAVDGDRVVWTTGSRVTEILSWRAGVVTQIPVVPDDDPSDVLALDAANGQTVWVQQNVNSTVHVGVHNGSTTTRVAGAYTVSQFSDPEFVALADGRLWVVDTDEILSCLLPCDATRELTTISSTGWNQGPLTTRAAGTELAMSSMNDRFGTRVLDVSGDEATRLPTGTTSMAQLNDLGADGALYATGRNAFAPVDRNDLFSVKIVPVPPPNNDRKAAYGISSRPVVEPPVFHRGASGLGRTLTSDAADIEAGVVVQRTQATGSRELRRIAVTDLAANSLESQVVVRQASGFSRPVISGGFTVHGNGGQLFETPIGGSPSVMAVAHQYNDEGRVLAAGSWRAWMCGYQSACLHDGGAGPVKTIPVPVTKLIDLGADGWVAHTAGTSQAVGHFVGATWVSTSLGTAPSVEPPIAMAAGVVAYRDGNDMKVMHLACSSPPCAAQTLALNVGTVTAIAMDAPVSSKRTIAFVEGSALRQYSTNDAAGNVTAGATLNLPATGNYHSLALSGNDFVVVDDERGQAMAGRTDGTTRSLDTTPPGVVTDVERTDNPSAPSVTLRWTNPRDLDLAGVRIFRGPAGATPTDPWGSDGRLVFQGNTWSFTDNTVEPGVSYSYAIFAMDFAGNTTGSVDGGAAPPPVSGGGGGVGGAAPPPSDATTATTDEDGDGATSDRPVEVTVTSPNGGDVAIEAATDDATSGFNLLGRTYDITAPDATVEEPLVLTFRVDGSALAEADVVSIFRNGVLVPGCASDAGTTATPDPCVSSRTVDGDDRVIEVRSSRASRWSAMQLAPGFAAVCDPETTPPSGFDDANGVHEGGIDCAVFLGLASGTSSTTYDPAARVTREQTAALLARLVGELGVTLPEPTRRGFRDTNGRVHEEAIARLAEAGILTGHEDGTFRPTMHVTRAQMAAVFARTYAYVLGRPMATSGASFEDSQQNVHRASIDAVVTTDVALGVSASEFGPGQAVNRGQMASFVSRLFNRIGIERNG